ncbi:MULTISPECIES: TIGR02171 family protein [unclassified Fibrobacter]|uniref:TIGR02171 family lipoprotein n=1 Tax=unclassified Fibrobacter TaxID=2634177 RepID=UPI000D6D82E2|nr:MULTISPECIES: TIGR02171 family protein [unclassified Fibrobacter]PWJ71667.1 uncharacterized protein (TIGR02171 family) [Fibrobacter sp. UWR4]PZW74108.1 uncharacterized protein (TIGR02171 family) [Fibrobacter sp. UWR1]
MKQWIILLFGVICLCACTTSDDYALRSTNVEMDNDESHEGLIYVHSKDGFVVLGTNRTKALFNEKPKMGVRFDYDFSLGKHEVTRAEFSKYTTDDWGFFVKSSDSLPVTDLTYYDAILYANARSKAEGYDTAYTYSSALINVDGRCSGMEALKFSPDVDAYRLPTEAEWMLVASQDWDVEKAWTQENGMSRVHNVCSKGENREGFCDMAGNAMEWMNDWLGIYKDTVVYDYAGAPDGALSGTRIVKGGGFTTPKEFTSFTSRGDTYDVVSNSHTVYVGFRIAFGRIPNAMWLSNDGISVEDRLIPKISVRALRTLVGTARSKLVFRNELTHNLAFVDYSYAPQMAIEIKDTLNCFHPDISPDGSLVAFSTGTEGIDGPSSIYVRQLTVNGDSLVKLDVKNAAIPRWRVTEDGDTVIVYVSNAGDNTSDGTFKSTSTWQVPFSNYHFGTPKKMFDGAYHGGVSYDNRLAVTGARRLRARIADSAGVVMDDSSLDTIWYNEEQACNASLAKDSSKRTLFLDFASKTGEEFIGHSYARHEYILIADSTGKLIDSVAAPSGYTFDHTEWALGGYMTTLSRYQPFIVASLTTNDGAHEKIVLVNLMDHSITELIEGTEIWHPTFWVEKASLIDDEKINELDRDSAAIYYEGVDSKLIASKMNVFWNKCNYLKVVALGSSRMSLGFISNRISYGASFNMATIPSDMEVSRYIAVNYALNHCKKLKFLVVGVDFDLWGEAPGVNLSQNLGSVPGLFYDANHDFWVDQGYDLLKKLSNRYIQESSHLKFISQRNGWLEYSGERSWTNGIALVADSTWSDYTDLLKNGISQLTDIIEKAKEKDVIVVGVIFPQSPYYKKTGSFGRHGMRRSHAIKLIETLHDMEKDFSNFRLIDENLMGDHDYSDSLAYDYDHLNGDGAYQITSRIDSVLNQLGGK